MFLGQKLVRIAAVVSLFVGAADCGHCQITREGPPAEPINLAAADGVQLKGTYFPGGAQSAAQKKQTTPVVLLHDYKSNRAVFNPLISQLQGPAEAGADRPHFAVIAIDLRAHGESVKQVLPTGVPVDLDAAKLSKEGLEAMAAFDMEAVRGLLVEKNDAGELNINKLCLVGSGMGASVAANWALADWTAPPLAVGKQGQDVRAIALISPMWSYRGLSMQGPMKFNPLKQNVAWLLIAGGQDPKVKSDFDRIQKQLERGHPLIGNKPGGQRQGLAVNLLPTSLQGDSLLGQSAAAINAQIVKFFTENVAALQLPWSKTPSVVTRGGE
jgi:pimeloyl-ACP methyl ester carboxylesterase